MGEVGEDGVEVEGIWESKVELVGEKVFAGTELVVALS